MDFNMICKFVFLSTFVFIVRVQSTPIDVTTLGAKADENTDCLSEPLMKAWTDACASANPSTIVIPPGTYLLNPILFKGPCKGPIEIQVKGTIKAPADHKVFKEPNWVVFNKVDCLTLTGGGVFDGQGTGIWGKVCDKSTLCRSLPINLRFNSVTNSIVQDITTKDSKQFHVNVQGSQNITFTRFNVATAENSINTDGIHITKSSGINITDSVMVTGDDCVSMGDGCDQVTISKVTCGPGHGISVGSLGRYEGEKPVTGLSILNCTFKNTENGVRIKTWPDSTPCTVSDLRFEDLQMNNVETPILIDQQYCPRNKCNKNEPSKVKISKVSFKNIRGTSSTQVAVKIVCSSGIPCENVEFSDIDLTYSGQEGPALSECSNVKPILSGKQNPPACAAAAAPSSSSTEEASTEEE